MAEASSVAQVQADFKPVMDELQLRVKELRDLQVQLEEERGQFGEGLAETKTSMEKIESRITKLQEQQRTLGETFNAPRLSSEQVKQVETDKQLGVFLEFCRFAAGHRKKLTTEELEALYPDGRRYRLPDEAGQPWRKVEPAEARALVENTAGQILVPESFDTSIIQTVEETSIVRPLATTRSVASDREKYRKLTQFSVAYGEALELGGSVSESNITPSEDYQYIEDAYGLAYFGANELMDSDVELVQYMMQSFARAKRETEDEKFLTGSGHASHEPEALVDSSTITAVTAANAASITFEDLIDVTYGYENSSSTPLKDVYRRAGVYFMHPFTELAIMKIRGDGGGGAGTGDFVWQPAVTAGNPNTIWGHALYTSTNLSQIGTGNDSVWYGDVRSTYRILDRMGMTMQRLVELKALAGLVGFLFKFRNTGGIIRSEAARILQHP